MASTATTQSPLLVPRGALEGKPPIPISRPVWIIGSRKGCHLHLVSEHVSQAHAVIINTGRGLFIKDLASRTHTYVNRLPVKEVQLADGDKVQIGPFKFYFRDPTANPGDKPPVAPAAVLRWWENAFPCRSSSA
jgi:pSer/pThr/pTyr-binding forkhead associated (FHA) protein